MNIVHVLAPGVIGGANTVVRLLASAQRDAGHQARIVAIVNEGAGEHPFVVEAQASGVEAIAIDVRPRAYRTERNRVRELLGRLAPSVVHTHGYRADVIDGAAARSLGIPVVATVHGFTGGSWKNRLYQRIQRRAYRSFDGIVVVSEPLVDDIRRSGIEPRRIHLIPNAFRPTGERMSRSTARQLLSLDCDRFTVGWVGRLSHEKGADLFIDALAIAAASVDIHASVIGDGPERGALERQAALRGVASRVTFHGTRMAAERCFNAFDLFVLSSRTEGTPMVLLEAMAAGVPIVAAHVGGVPAVLGHGAWALVRAEDPRALAAKIVEACQHAKQAFESAAAARCRVETEYGVGPWVERHDALYRRLRDDRYASSRRAS